MADATPPPELAMLPARNAVAVSLTNRLGEFAAQNVQEEMHELRNLTVKQSVVYLVVLRWFWVLSATHLDLAAFLSVCALVWAFWETVANAVAVVREANAEARAAGAPAGLTDEARAAGITDEEWEEVAAYFEAMDDYSDEGRLFWSTRGGPPRVKPADLAAAALGGVAAYVALVVPLAL